MKLCRFRNSKAEVRIGLVAERASVRDLTTAGVTSLSALLEGSNVIEQVKLLASQELPSYHLADVVVLPPVERQEIWAVGVTYLRSKKARMEESEFSASAYDLVYDAARPELFFKSLPEKAVGFGEPVGIRRDAKWNVPEPELVLVLNSRGQIVGYTIGNDMSSRDIEGENILYLPQAKIYDRSCAIGPFVEVGASESEARSWKIELQISRADKVAFSGETSVANIKRPFAELAEYLFRSQTFPHGAMLLTGTGIVPPDNFTLEAGDVVRIDISGIGSLENPVVAV